MTSCKIIVENDPRSKIELAPGEMIRIGRAVCEDAKCFVLDFPDVSIKHAEIHCSDRACTLVDIGSAYGTWVNDKRLNKGRHCPIRQGDILRFGDHRLKVIECPEKDTDGIYTQSVCRANLRSLLGPGRDEDV